MVKKMSHSIRIQKFHQFWQKRIIDWANKKKMKKSNADFFYSDVLNHLFFETKWKCPECNEIAMGSDAKKYLSHENIKKMIENQLMKLEEIIKPTTIPELPFCEKCHIHDNRFVKIEKIDEYRIDSFDENFESKNDSEFVDFKHVGEECEDVHPDMEHEEWQRVQNKLWSWINIVMLRFHHDQLAKTMIRGEITDIVDGEIITTKDISPKFINPIEDEDKDKFLEKYMFSENIENFNDLESTLLLKSEKNKLIENIEKVEKVEKRVIVKLKIYDENLIKFSDEEIQYMLINSNLKKNNLLEYIGENTRSTDRKKIGLESKKIELLTNKTVTNIDAIFKRFKDTLKKNVRK